MLQQTRVDTVLNYYERFLGRFPNIQALATASREHVLKHWEGLGYYRRAVHLHEAARQLHDSRESIPSDVKSLSNLPGIGSYTAAAIASIAFGRPEAAVDGNVCRVVARLFAIEQDVSTPAGIKLIRAVACQLLPKTRPGDFNQAWMDLGSLVCTPSSPDCSHCPLVQTCMAKRMDRENELPIRNTARTRTVTDVTAIVGLFIHRRRLLVRRRASGGLWSDLWEFPNTPLESLHSHRTNAESGSGKRHSETGMLGHLEALAASEQLDVKGPAVACGAVHHRLTHRALTFPVFLTHVVPMAPKSTKEPRRWVNVEQFAELAVSTAHRRIFRQAKNDFLVALHGNSNKKR